LGGRVGGRSQSGAQSTSESYKQNVSTAEAAVHPSPRNLLKGPLTNNERSLLNPDHELE